MLSPTNGKVVVQMDPEPEQTAGGIYMPDTARKSVQYGVVLAVGDPAFSTVGTDIPIPHGLVAGARVACGKYAGVEIEHDGLPLVIFNQTDILAIVEPQAVAVA